MSESHDIKTLITDNRRMIERICLHASYGNVEQCAELEALCYEALWLHRDTLRPGSNERQTKRWVKWRCRGAIANWRRSNSHTTVSLDEVETDTLTAPDYQAAHELYEELAVALPPQEKLMLEMIVEGAPATEMATRLNLNPENAKTMRRRLLQKLEQRLKDIINQ